MKLTSLAAAIAAFAAMLLAAGTAFSAPQKKVSSIVRPAPAFTLEGGKTLKAFRGQPVVVVVANGPRDRQFRNQVKRFEQEYGELAARSVVFVAAFTGGNSGELRSSIPFGVARDGASLAAGLGLGGVPYGVAIIGQDGNVDLLTQKIAPVYKVRDAILNNYALQSAERRAPKE